ncbi:MAG: class I SAM-dependent methyltransferase [Myxococcales bacterium]
MAERALGYDVTMWLLRPLGIERARARLVAGLQGRVLEVGVGTGLTLRHYPEGREPAVGIDLDRTALGRAERRRRGRTALMAADVQALPFPDGAFDAAVVSLVFCSVAEPARGLAELRRVLKKGGELRLIEHVRSCRPAVARWQDWLAPGWLRCTGDCHFDRRTGEAVEAAGFVIEREEPHLGGIGVELRAFHR